MRDWVHLAGHLGWSGPNGADCIAAMSNGPTLPQVAVFHRMLRVLAFATGVGAAVPAPGYEQVLPPPVVELPKALSPAESLQAIRVPAGFRVELVAAEPMVADPIDMVWSADGRMWVVEMADYPSGMDARGSPGGRIRVLESIRGDSHYDRSTLFAEGLLFPTSVLPWRRGVLVTAAPDIFYLEDTDGDGKADRSETLFTGLGEGNQQHRANGLQWGLDGWVYLANGDSGGVIRSTRTGEQLELGRRDFRILPDEGRLEPQSGRSQFGRNRDDWGNWFGGNNSNPIWHYALDDRYLRRNPHFAPPDAVVTVPQIPGAAPVYPASRLLARFNDPYGASRFTSACGVMVYRDDLLGPGFAGNIFVSEPVHNLVSRQVVRPSGVTFTSRRAPEEATSEFIASTDNWSRFVYTRAGPDGALYVADMYRLVIEHPQWIPAEWQKILGNLRAGDDRGRIYRVVPEGAALRAMPRLDRADMAGLVAALESPSGTVRDLAQQQLHWRRSREAVPALEALATGSSRPASRAQAQWTLELIGGLSPQVVEAGLRDPDPGVRRQAVRLTEGFVATAPELLTRLIELVEDPAPPVRQQVAYTLGEWPQPAAGEALARLVRREKDTFILAAAMSSALPHADTMLARRDGGGNDDALLQIAIATQNRPALTAWLKGITADRGPADISEQLGKLATFLDTLGRNGQSLAALHVRADGGLRDAIAATQALFASARAIAASGGEPIERRIAAVRILGRGFKRQQEDVVQLLALLAPQAPGELQVAAIAALGHQKDESIPERLLQDWNGYGAETRAAVLGLLTSRVAWTDLLLDWIAAEPARAAQIGAAQRAALTQHSVVRVAQRAARVLEAGIDPNRQRVVEDYLGRMAKLDGEAARGATVFTAACAACHRFGNTPGGAIGPDLAVVTDRSRPYLVTHILDPNRAVEARSMLYTATLNNGRVLAGMLLGEAGNSITFAGLDGTEQIILRSELKRLESTGRSLMPDGLEATVSPQQLADLVAFLAER